MLYGSMSVYSPLRTWLKQASKGGVPQPVVLLVGASGTGKTTLATHMIDEAGMHPHNEPDLPIEKQVQDARSPTFLGLRRVLVVDDASDMNKKEWKALGEALRGFTHPTIILLHDEADCPWLIRKGAMLIRMNTPRPEDLLKMLTDIQAGIGSEHSTQDLSHISKMARTWREAEHMMRTAPPGFRFSELERVSFSAPKRQAKMILKGDHEGSDFQTHPLSILSMADWNGADPQILEAGITLHSHQWNVDGLSRIGRAFLTTLRSRTQNRPPFRKSLSSSSQF